MTYVVTFLKDDQEFYADFATTLGLDQLTAEAEKLDLPELNHLFAYGWADDVVAMRNELRQLKTAVSSKDIASSIIVLEQTIDENSLAEIDAIVLSDGVVTGESTSQNQVEQSNGQ